MRDHKSLLAWQRAHEVVVLVIDGLQGSWKPSAAALFSQLQRASLSIQLNIAEGYAYRSPRMFRRHLDIAYGSGVETTELLELALEKNLLPPEVALLALRRSRQAQALVLGLIKRCRAKSEAKSADPL